MKEPMDFVARIVNHEKPIYSLLYYLNNDNDVKKTPYCRIFRSCLAIVSLYTVIFLPRKEKFARKRVNFRRFSLLYFRYVIQRESVENKLQK